MEKQNIKLYNTLSHKEELKEMLKKEHSKTICGQQYFNNAIGL
jgi:hypothetical protein|tara:strand:+ start:2089 stop:2217 length:129 start_codon:yes stop_codon:yes gene_type:complete